VRSADAFGLERRRTDPRRDHRIPASRAATPIRGDRSLVRPADRRGLSMERVAAQHRESTLKENSRSGC
jgi:hypothetical protein